jgi:hypothetical protein
MLSRSNQSPSPSPVQRTGAALFLLALVAVPVAVALVWGRTSHEQRLKRAEKPLSLGPVLPVGETVELGSEDRRFLASVFWRNLRNQKTEVGPDEVPRMCRRSIQPVVYATLYAPGRRRLQVNAREKTLARAVRRCAREMVERPEYRKGSFQRAQKATARLDIITRELPLSVTRRHQFASMQLVGPLGVALHDQRGTGTFLPSEFAELRALDHRGMLSEICRQLDLSPTAWQGPQRKVSMLWTESFLTTAEDKPASLLRGLPLVQEVSATDADQSARLAAGFLARLADTGSRFAQSYNATTGTATPGGSVVLQARATAALARHAGRCNEPRRRRLLATCRPPLALLVRDVRTSSEKIPIAFVPSEESVHNGPSITGTAAVLSAFCEWRAASGEKDWDELITRLTRFLLLVQEENGRFHPIQEPPRPGSEPESSGRTEGAMEPEAARRQALAAGALILAFRELENPSALLAAQRALEALRKAPKGLDSPLAGSVLCDAVLALSAHLPIGRYMQMVERAMEPLFERQVAPEDAPAPDLSGGSLDRFPPATAQTAEDLRAFAVGWLLAQRRGQNAAPHFASRCRHAAIRAARYLVQFQFQPANSYYVLESAKAMGGFRRRPGSNLVPLKAAYRGLNAMDAFWSATTETEQNDHDSQSQN